MALDRRFGELAEDVTPLTAGLIPAPIVAAAPQIPGHPLDQPSALLVAERRVVVADRRYGFVVVRPSPLPAIAGLPNARAPSHCGYRVGTSADRRAGTPAFPQSRGDRGGRVLHRNPSHARSAITPLDMRRFYAYIAHEGDALWLRSG